MTKKPRGYHSKSEMRRIEHMKGNDDMTLNGSEAREWWIEPPPYAKSNGALISDAWSIPAMSSPQEAIHVIEKSYADQLEKERDELSQNLSNLTGVWEEERIMSAEKTNKLESELAAARKEFDALKWGYDGIAHERDSLKDQLAAAKADLKMQIDRNHQLVKSDCESLKQLTEARTEIERLKFEKTGREDAQMIRELQDEILSRGALLKKCEKAFGHCDWQDESVDQVLAEIRAYKEKK